MRRDHLPVMFGALLGLWACGGTDQEPLALEIRTDSAALVATMAKADVRIHTGTVECLLIRIDRMNVQPTYQAVVNVKSGAAKGEVGIDQIRPGPYTVAVWGLDESGQVVAFGCAPVEIETGVQAKVSITVGDPG